MLFMNIVTWEPGTVIEFRKRFAEKGLPLPEGIKPISLFADVGGCRIFWTFEADSAQDIFFMSTQWDDLMKLEVIPIVEYELESGAISQQ